MSYRYFLYLVLMDMLMNVVIFIPTILYQERFQGTIMSGILAIPISTLFSFLFSRALMKFPDMGLPEIFKLKLHKWFRIPLLIYLGVMWYISGALILAGFAVLSKRYINPDMSIGFTLLFFMVIAAFGALQSSKTVLYLTEIVLLLNVPFIFFIMIKALSSPFLRWKEILQMSSWVLQWPSWHSLSASTYLFTGYLNMAVFNRVYKGKLTTKHHWIIPLLGLAITASTFFIPIGFHGVDGVDNYVYPWIATADSMKMEYGFIERVIFVFLVLYISLSLLFGAVVWHVALELIKSGIEIKKESVWKKYIPWGVICLFMIPPLYLVAYTDQPIIFQFSRGWLSHRFAAEILLIILVLILALRRKKA